MNARIYQSGQSGFFIQAAFIFIKLIYSQNQIQNIIQLINQSFLYLFLYNQTEMAYQHIIFLINLILSTNNNLPSFYIFLSTNLSSNSHISITHHPSSLQKYLLLILLPNQNIIHMYSKILLLDNIFFIISFWNLVFICYIKLLYKRRILTHKRMSYRNYQTTTSKLYRRKGYETEVNTDKIILHYDPFNSPNIMRMHQQSKEKKTYNCQKALFQDDENQDFDLLESKDFIQTKEELTMLKEKSNNILSTIFKDAKQKKKAVPKNTINSQDKQNIKQQDHFSFNNQRRLKYPQTPKFKEHLQSPLPTFMKSFTSKIQDLKLQVKKKSNIISVQFDSFPNRQLGYRFFICIAQSLKKQQGIAQCRCLYKISLYLQPFDQSTWEWAVKFQQQQGYLQEAFLLSKTGFMFTHGQSLALKYVRLAERCQKPIQQIRGIVGFLNGKIQKYSKIYYELGRLEWKSGNKQNAFKIFYFLTQSSQNPMNFVFDVARFLQTNKYIQEAIQVLLSSIQRNIKIYAVYSYYLKLVEQLYPHVLHNAIQFVIQKGEQNLPVQVRWKLYLQIAQIYLRFSENQFSRQYLKNSLQMAPVPSKLKPYLAILKVQKKIPTLIKNSMTIVQINKNKFINGQQPIIYNFSQWKHYLHYSLFYLFNGSIAAKKQLEQATAKWNYAGRLWAQVLWMQRAKGEHILQKWIQIVMEVPKSGEVWCQGGRIYTDLGDYKKAQFCFEAAIHLTPQYGDSFIEELKLLMLLGKYREIKNLKKRMLYAEPFYGNIWCYLKSNSKSTVIDVWRKAKIQLKQQLYKNNIEYMDLNNKKKNLTALESYNKLFSAGYKIGEFEKQKIMNAYDQLQNNKG